VWLINFAEEGASGEVKLAVAEAGLMSGQKARVRHCILVAVVHTTCVIAGWMLSSSAKKY